MSEELLFVVNTPSSHMAAPPIKPISASALLPLLKNPVAEGSFAYIYKINWDGTTIGVKKFKESTSSVNSTSDEDFDKEVQVLRSLNHPNVIRFLGAVHEPG